MNTEALTKLSQKSIYLGTSSWKYEGWKGLIYNDRYCSAKEFEARCLTEYAKTFSVVGVDHTYYAPPSSKMIDRYKQQTPDHFRFILKAPDALTLRYFPSIPRYKTKAGKLNPQFLSLDYFKEQLFPKFQEFENKLESVIFEFSHFKKGTIESGSVFLHELTHFISKVKNTCPVPMAVEIRNRAWFVPRFLEKLIELKVTPVLNSWTLMPSPPEQIQLLKTFDFDKVIVRLLLKPQVRYQEAVNRFSPYSQIQDPQIETRKAVADLIKYCLESGKSCFILVNNRFEGCAPLTIKGILETLLESD
jgi:uncharacterized protein YecE (DUF72 family)